ncbi:ATP-binding cassette domain-containing protein [Pseudomonas oryzihabitans]|uniref:ABC transporter ATP-binding protein n=1 Tax=Pseudomonas oryzihabitans TaxID=47885 RepID=UPI002895728C|nr:ATP-binding cassette domain-containing protein [Pseudomonas oryzihabitans]MDT3722211.1 ATP-binding cassette domain-containing protein [Pseudomonas oryzihabitans]
MTTLLTTTALEIRAGDTPLVEPLSISLAPGQVLSIIGETGSGKSLFAQGVVGNLPAGLEAHGRIGLADGFSEDGRQAGRRRQWGRGLAVLPQEPWLSLDPTMRALAQVSETYTRVVGLPGAAARQKATTDLARLGLAGAERKYPFQLSGGMAQRLAFAATHAGGAPLLIADEPTKGLDRDRIDEVIGLLETLLAEGGSLLIITHDLEVARRLGGAVMIMLKGRVIESGTAEQVLGAPQHAYTRQLLAADPAHWCRRPQRQGKGEPVVAVEGLSASRGGRQLFEDLSFEVRPGEILGVTGPSGCGKSTLGDIVLGLAAPSGGRLRRQDGLSRFAFQKLHQDPVSAFAPAATIRQLLADLVRLHRLDAARIGRLMQRLRLDERLLDRLPGNISGGELQRFSLLRVLLLDPALIFADEPSSRLDLITQKEMIELLVETAEEAGTAILLVSHDEALVDAVADRRLQLSDPATPAQWQTPPAGRLAEALI